MNTPTRLHRPLALAALAAVLTIGACAGAGAPAASSSPPPASPSPAAPSDLPGGGGSSGDPGTGIGGPVDPAPVDPGTGQAKLVIPKPGQLNPRPLPAATLEATVDGRRVLVKATWWSGIEPCNVLDSVKVERSGTAFAITLIEGTGDPNAICIEIAMQKATIVDLGELEPGTYTISSPGGDATPVTVTVS
jgi:ABC-type transport system substrate-binding protein